MAASIGEKPESDAQGTAAEGSPRRGRGWLFWGCSTMLILIAAFVAALAYWAYSLYQYTSSEPVVLPVYEPKPGELDALRASLDAFERVAPGETGRVQPRLELSPDDLNALLAGSPEGERYAGKVHFRGEGERILADVSLPLDELGETLSGKIGIDALSGRYLNGTVALRVGMDGGMPVLAIASIVAGGKTVPAAYVSHIQEKNLLELSSLRNVLDALRGVRSAAIVEGKLVVEK